MHPLQIQILYKLITNPFLPYSQLKPKDIEGNLFMYHLKELIKESLVQKRSDGKYELSAKGQVFAETLSLENFKPRIQPKIVSLLVCKNNRGEFLLYKRKRQPFLGLVGFPYGKIHLGETILQAATRELQEKTGLSAKLIHKADVYLTTFQGQDLLAQTFCHVFTASHFQGNLIKNSDIGECFWGDVGNIEADELMPGFIDIYKLTSKPSSKLLFGEFVYHLK